MSVKKLALNKGLMCLLNEDFVFPEPFGKFRWFAVKKDNTFYAAIKYKGKRLYLHHLVLPAKKGFQVDHINRNGLDNRKENLRFATPSQNLCNRDKQSNNKSGFKGVHWNTQKKKWCAEIRFNGKKKHLGFFADPKEASEAYEKSAKETHKEFYYKAAAPKARHE